MSKKIFESVDDKLDRVQEELRGILSGITWGDDYSILASHVYQASVALKEARDAYEGEM